MPDKIIRNIRLTLEYDGTEYCGWQIQSHRSQVTGHKKKSIQEVIEETLRRILQEKVKVIASGRTDAGVHALAQVANFRTRSPVNLKKLQFSLNSLLPPDISVKKIEDIHPDFHSRFSAKEKTYRYTILNRASPSVFLNKYSYFYPYPLNISRMQKAAAILKGRHDFKAFCSSGSYAKDTRRSVKKIRVFRRDDSIFIEITAEGFLYNMARSIVGTLIEVGRNKFAPERVKQMLAEKDRSLCGPTAPARGLALVGVKY